MTYYLLIILLALPLISAAKVSEVMYNPAGSDFDLEWIEIQAELSEINNTLTILIDGEEYAFTPTASHYILAREYGDSDDADNDSFVNSYGLIPGEEIRFTLPNRQTTLLLDNVTYLYDPKQGADGDGRSLAYNGSTFLPSRTIGGTPGAANDFDTATLLINFLRSEYYLADYDHFFTLINRIEPRNASLTYTIIKENQTLKQETISFFINTRKTAGTGHFTFTEPGNYTLCAQAEQDLFCENINVIDQSTIPCDIALDLWISQTLLDVKEKLTYDFKVTNKTFPFTIEYGIQDVHEKWIRKQHNTTSLAKKAFTPKFEGIEKSYLINATLHTTCNDTNKENNHIERAIGVRGRTLENALALDDIAYDNLTCTLKAKVQATKADAKKVIHLRVKDSEVIGEAKADLLNKGEHTLRLTLPFERCPQDDLIVTLSGLGLSVERILPLNITKRKESLRFEIINQPALAKQNEPFSLRIKVTNPTDEHHNITTLSKLAYANTSERINLHIAEHSSIEFELSFTAQGEEAKIMIDHYVDEYKTPRKQRVTIPLEQEHKASKERKKIVLNDEEPLTKTAILGSLLSLFAIIGIGKSI